MNKFCTVQPREFENKTIQKQRQELELLIGELRDRDRELNEMVLAHREQMKAWEMDRQKILMGEEKNAKLQRMYTGHVCSLHAALESHIKTTKLLQTVC